MQKYEITVSYKTLAKVFIAGMVGFELFQIAPFIIFLMITILVGITLMPVVDFGVKKGIPKVLSQVIVSLLMIGLFSFFVFIIVPAVINQIAEFIKHLPDIQKHLEESIDSPLIKAKVHDYFKNLPDKFSDSDSTDGILSMGGKVITAGYNLFLFLILSLYVMVDGDRAYHWALHFFSTNYQSKFNKTSSEIKDVVLSYVAGQLITSTFVAIYTFTVNSLMHTPATVLLTVIATLGDFIPVVGFVTAIGCAIIIMSMVSVKKAILLGILYLIYSLFENYFIIPRVYGEKMKLSKLAVLLSILIGGKIAGIKGTLLALPIAGSFPILEKYWMDRSKAEKQEIKKEELK